MNRIDRLTAILIHIQGRSRTSLGALTDRFQVGKRTIFRDIKALLEAGVPIGGDAGEGYFVVEGYHLPPVVFNKEEAAAILTGYKLIEKLADSKSVSNFSDALFKIKAVLRYHDKEFLENLEKGISVITPAHFSKTQLPDLHMEELQYAVASRRVIQISYTTPYNESSTDRAVEPLGLVNYSAKWHLIGYCRLRNALRDFRTDRIAKLSLTPETFQHDQHPDYLEFVENTLTNANLIEVAVSFTSVVSRMMGEQKYYFGLIEEKKVGDRVEMKFYTNSIDYFARWILSYGNQVKIIGPDELSVRILELIKELSLHHQ